MSDGTGKGKRAPTLPSDDITRALQMARRYVEVAYNNACALEYDNQNEERLLRLIDKALAAREK